MMQPDLLGSQRQAYFERKTGYGTPEFEARKDVAKALWNVFQTNRVSRDDWRVLAARMESDVEPGCRMAPWKIEFELHRLGVRVARPDPQGVSTGSDALDDRLSGQLDATNPETLEGTLLASVQDPDRDSKEAFIRNLFSERRRRIETDSPQEMHGDVRIWLCLDSDTILRLVESVNVNRNALLRALVGIGLLTNPID